MNQLDFRTDGPLISYSCFSSKFPSRSVLEALIYGHWVILDISSSVPTDSSSYPMFGYGNIKLKNLLSSFCPLVLTHDLGTQCRAPDKIYIYKKLCSVSVTFSLSYLISPHYLGFHFNDIHRSAVSKLLFFAFSTGRFTEALPWPQEQTSPSPRIVETCLRS